MGSAGIPEPSFAELLAEASRISDRVIRAEIREEITGRVLFLTLGDAEPAQATLLAAALKPGRERGQSTPGNRDTC